MKNLHWCPLVVLSHFSTIFRNLRLIFLVSLSPFIWCQNFSRLVILSFLGYSSSLFPNRFIVTFSRGKTFGFGAGKKASSRSSKVDLQFPMGCFTWFLRASKYPEQVSAGALVYLAAMLTCLATKVFLSFSL